MHVNLYTVDEKLVTKVEILPLRVFENTIICWGERLFFFNMEKDMYTEALLLYPIN